MNGRLLAGGIVAFTAVFAVALFWFQNYAYYEEVRRDSILVAGADIPVTGYQGIDASTTGLKRRGCFQIDPAALAAAEPAANPQPLNPPFWFDCFDAKSLAQDLDAGRATAYVAAREEYEGIDRLLAVYPDGRAYEWRQLNERFAR